LPALPQAWPTGTIEGMSCRGQIILDRLHWNGNKVEAEMTSAKDQRITLVLPREIAAVDGDVACVAPGATPNERTVSLPVGGKVKLVFQLK
jgi:hypothetical protein